MDRSTFNSMSLMGVILNSVPAAIGGLLYFYFTAQSDHLERIISYSPAVLLVALSFGIVKEYLKAKKANIS